LVSEVRVPALRLKPPSWRDGRLLVGVLIVLSSMVLGARVVAAAGRTVPVLAAVTDLPSGHRLSASDVRAVPVHLAAGVAGYLPARAGVPVGGVLVRPVGAGELVPTAAVGDASVLALRPVAVPVPAPLPEGLRPGAGVDLWSSAKQVGAGETGYAPPVRIAEGAEVSAVTVTGTGLGGTGTTTVQVLLDERQLRSVLDALANGAKIAVVPAPRAATAPEVGATGAPAGATEAAP
jgi:hypothetical protein